MTFKTLLALMTPADKVLLWVLILTSVGSFAAVDWRSETGQFAIVKYDADHELRKSLHDEGTFTVSGAVGTTRIEITDGHIRVTDSACPQKLCVYQGEISRVGEILVCAPNKVAIWLEGKRVNEFDAITG